jgi:hypothetical protein
MSGWLARSNFNFKLFADVLAKFVLFVSPGLVAFVGGVFLPHCVPVSDSFARACLTFPAVDDLLPAGIGIGIPVDGAKLPPEPPQPAWTTPAKVLRVIDGDTLEIEVRYLTSMLVPRPSSVSSTISSCSLLTMISRGKEAPHMAGQVNIRGGGTKNTAKPC